MFAADIASNSKVPLERLEQEITRLASEIYAGTCRWLEVVAEFDRREGWASSGCRSCAEWIAWKCAVAPRAAREHVRVARRLAELPAIHGEFHSGRLSYSKVRALTRIAEPDSEQELLELAEHATAAQLERIVRGVRRVSAEEAEELHAERFLSSWWEADGSLSIQGQLPPEDGALFLQAIDAAHDRLRGRAGDGGPAEPPDASPAEAAGPRRQTNADALVAMADLALGGEAQSSGDRYQVVVHVDLDSLSHDSGDTVRLADGSALAPESARRLACDAAVVSIHERGGSPMSVGRKTRSVAPALRRALEARDGRCRFPGCENRRFLEAHHIRHWARGGETSKANLILICRHHHRQLHEGGFTVERRGEEILFRRPGGSRVAASPTLPSAGGADLRAQAMQPSAGTGERAEHGYIVDLVAASGT